MLPGRRAPVHAGLSGWSLVLKGSAEIAEEGRLPGLGLIGGQEALVTLRLLSSICSVLWLPTVRLGRRSILSERSAALGRDRARCPLPPHPEKPCILPSGEISHFARASQGAGTVRPNPCCFPVEGLVLHHWLRKRRSGAITKERNIVPGSQRQVHFARVSTTSEPPR